MKEKKPQNINMGQRFRDAREAKGWSRELLAEKVGLSAPFIADLELGNSGISLEQFVQLCQLLNVKVILPYPPKGVSFKWSKQKFVCGKIMVKRKITAKLAVIFLKNGGPNRDRTDDLTDANRTLSQLSYRPIFSYLI